VIVDFAGYGDTTARSIDAVRRDGRIVVVGMGTLESTISTRDLILKQAVVIGSNGGTKEDVAAVYGMLASGDLEPVVNLIGFDEIPDGLERLREHSVTGRVVATIGA